MLEVSGGTLHRDVATRWELAYHLERWTTDDETDFPVAYLAFHGSPGCTSPLFCSQTDGAEGRVKRDGTWRESGDQQLVLESSP